MTKTLVEAHDLERTFGSDGASVAAIRHVDLSMGEGEFVSVMGPSGCGKSTLLHLLGGLDRPTSGQVTFDGRRVDQQSMAQWARFRRSNIGFVFQSYNLVPNLTVLDNVRLPAMLADRRSRGHVTRARELLARLGMEGRENALPSTLSGGEAQRTAIARALVNDPRLLLADEPTGALDSAATGEVIRLLRQINADGVAVLVVSHDPRVATAAGRLLMMRDGRIVDETLLDGVGGAALDGLVDIGGRS